MNARDGRNIEQFFDGLASTEQPPLNDVAGTVRFDIDEDGTVGHIGCFKSITARWASRGGTVGPTPSLGPSKRCSVGLSRVRRMR
jgi:hypothetical protein